MANRTHTNILVLTRCCIFAGRFNQRKQAASDETSLYDGLQRHGNLQLFENTKFNPKEMTPALRAPTPLSRPQIPLLLPCSLGHQRQRTGNFDGDHAGEGARLLSDGPSGCKSHQHPTLRGT